MLVLNFDEFDMPTIRAELLERFPHASMIAGWTDQQCRIYWIGELLGGLMLEGLTEGSHRVELMVSSDQSLTRETILCLMDLRIIYGGREHVFATLACDDESVPRLYDADVTDSKSWMTFNYVHVVKP